MKLEHVLSRTGDVEIDLDDYRADALKKAAKFWVGQEASKFNKGKSISALTKVFGEKTAAKKAAIRLSDKQKRVLEIFALYGPVVSGTVLAVEALQRKLIEKQDDSAQSYYQPRHDDIVNKLREQLVLLDSEYSYGGYGYGYGYGSYGRRYPELTLHPAIAGAIDPAEPLPWEPSEPISNAKGTQSRSSAEPALDMWRVAQSLSEMGNWKTLKGDALSKGSRNKLRRMTSLASAEDNPLDLPDPESFYYELLREMEFLSVEVEPRHVLSAELEQHFAAPAVAQAWHVLRAWLDMRLWQDGIGVVPDRDVEYEPVRIEPDSLRSAKELLIWAFCRLAHSPCDWLDLEGFLKDFWRTTHEAAVSFYWSGYTWQPEFAMARSKQKLPTGPDRNMAYWLDDEGTWVANAIAVTFVALGLVQRGESDGKKKRPCFRLTDLGRRAFAAPKTEAEDHQDATPFLTVQPNHEILAYMDAADAKRICTLARFAHSGKTNAGPVQCFSLSRESVYGALESGMTVAQIEAFLVEHGKTELPTNVAHALTQWSGKRESLVLRHGVTLGLMAEGRATEAPQAQGESLGEGSAVLKKMNAKRAATDYPGWTVLDHQRELPKAWNVDELGCLRNGGDDTLSRVRLAYMADEKANGWLISEKSITRARKQGFTAEQMLAWLSIHLLHETPALLKTAIRNWTGRASVFAGKVQLLQILEKDARDAILHSDVFRPLLAGHIAPCWFIVRDDKASEVKRLLKCLGFLADASHQIASIDECRGIKTTNEPPTKITKKISRTRRRRRR
ncbi:MAG: hypothetical protein IID44_09460 [Planctomycetes bacterium]|nr:hypothetical protein [Planctomycetota bacterium]